MLRAMTSLVALMMCVAGFATGSAFASDATPTPALTGTDDGYAAPVCGDPVVETLSAFDCTGAEPVPSLDPASADDPSTVGSLQAEAAASAATMPSPAALPAFCRLHAALVFEPSPAW